MLLRKYIHALLSSLQSEPFLSPTTIGKKLPIYIIFKNKFAIKRFCCCSHLLRASLKIENGNLRCHRKLPWILEYDSAIADYNKAIEFDPNEGNAYNNRGNTYQDLQQYDSAIEDYNRAIELDPNDAGAYNNRGNIYHDLQQYKKAIEDYNKAIERNPNLVQGYYNRGNSYYNLEQYERAIEDYNKAIELNPHDAETYYNRELALGKLEVQQGVPGFNVVFAIAGLLAVAYLLRRRK
jgi:PGF-CTERM protein